MFFLLCEKSNFTSIPNNRLRYCFSVIILVQGTIYADLCLKLNAYLNRTSFSENQ